MNNGNNSVEGVGKAIRRIIYFFTMEQKPLNGLYDAFILREGDYPMVIFTGENN
jgi:hypothetical protein